MEAQLLDVMQQVRKASSVEDIKFGVCATFRVVFASTDNGGCKNDKQIGAAAVALWAPCLSVVKHTLSFQPHFLIGPRFLIHGHTLCTGSNRMRQQAEMRVLSGSPQGHLRVTGLTVLTQREQSVLSLLL